MKMIDPRRYGVAFLPAPGRRAPNRPQPPSMDAHRGRLTPVRVRWSPLARDRAGWRACGPVRARCGQMMLPSTDELSNSSPARGQLYGSVTGGQVGWALQPRRPRRRIREQQAARCHPRPQATRNRIIYGNRSATVRCTGSAAGSVTAMRVESRQVPWMGGWWRVRCDQGGGR
jgi:hypothetical protein